MNTLLSSADPLLTAFAREVESRISDARLISLEIEPLSDRSGDDLQTTIRVLKASSRVCFIQGQVQIGDEPILKARAIYRKK